MGADGDDYHGEFVADPYRWLENTNSAQTAAWIAAQNDLTQGWLAGCQDREAISERLVKLADYPRFGVPFERGGRWFGFRESRLPDPPVLSVMHAPDQEVGAARPEHAGGGRHGRGQRRRGHRRRDAAGLRHQRERLGLADLAGPRHEHGCRPR
jgi:hypothetical protein